MIPEGSCPGTSYDEYVILEGGAECTGLYSSPESAEAAAEVYRKRHPDRVYQVQLYPICPLCSQPRSEHPAPMEFPNLFGNGDILLS